MNETARELPTQITSIADIADCACRIEHNKLVQEIRKRNMTSICLQLADAYQSGAGEPRKHELRRAYKLYERRSQICERQTNRLESIIPSVDKQIASDII